MNYGTLALICIISILCNPLCAEPLIRCTKTERAPLVDGVLDDSCWENTPAYQDFTNLDSGSPAKQSTRIQCVYDSEKIYFSVTCNESEDAITATKANTQEVRGSDSYVELYIHPVPVTDYLKSVQVPQMSYYICALNAAGAHYGQCGRFVPLPGPFEVKTKVNTQSWQAEVAIPFESLKISQPEQLALWKFQVRRNAYLDGAREASVLFPALKIANNIDTFGWLAFTETPDQKINIPKPKTDQTKIENARKKSIQALSAELKNRKQALALVPHPAISDTNKILPDFVPAVKDLGKSLEVRIARNEYEPASFVIWSPKEIKNVSVVQSDFRGKQGKLPKGALDVRWVKCWYQAGTQIIEMCGYELTPELLLKDPELVQVDLSKQQNLIPYSTPPKRADRPDDSASLQSMKILPKEFAQQVWITVKTNPEIPAGVYKGSFKVLANGKKIGAVDVEIEVLDFELQESAIDSCLYVCSGWGPSATENSPVCARAEIKNLAEHGIRYVGLWEHARDMETVARMMQQAGLQIDKIFIGNVGSPIPVGAATDDPDYVQSRAEIWADALKNVSEVKQIYQYLVDEASGETLASEKPIADALHRAGAKTWVAANRNYFPYGGDFIDLAVVSSTPDAKLAETAHKAGKQIYSYANPQCGLELPETYRRNYGLLLWQAGYDGGFDFAYNCGFDDPWNDCDHSVWKDHMMVYPTKSGVIDTIQWEGWREGVDDCRYLATLQHWQAEALKSGNSRIANEAEQAMEKLKSGGSDSIRNLGQVRDNIIRLILKCRKACKNK